MCMLTTVCLNKNKTKLLKILKQDTVLEILVDLIFFSYC